jgi:hypothetical protein
MSAMAYAPRSLKRTRKAKRVRRTKAEVAELEEAIIRILAEDNPATVRQCFYRLVAAGAIAKTEKQYNVIKNRLATLRRAGRVPYGWIADNTRWVRKPRTYGSVEQAVRDTADTYRRSLWDQQPVYIECWSEKDALAGVLAEVTTR